MYGNLFPAQRLNTESVLGILRYAQNDSPGIVILSAAKNLHAGLNAASISHNEAVPAGCALDTPQTTRPSALNQATMLLRLLEMTE